MPYIACGIISLRGASILGTVVAEDARQGGSEAFGALVWMSMAICFRAGTPGPNLRQRNRPYSSECDTNATWEEIC